MKKLNAPDGLKQFIWFLPLLFLQACLSVPTRFGGSPQSLHGKIAGDRYIAPENWFSFKIYDAKLPGSSVSDSGGDNSGTVMYSDDFGGLVRVDYMRMNKESRDALKKIGEEAFLKNILDNWIGEFVIPNSPETTLIEEVFSKDKHGKGMHFEIIDMPKGSTLSTENGRMDAIRGLVSFVSDDWFFILSEQAATGLRDFAPHPEGQEAYRKKEIADLKTRLLSRKLTFVPQ
ncbi:MAG: hypothetical protein IPP68_04470 [Elusimicrobia bacterium]|nr:hypothetical protein [Elusimicrobiota bacterium]